MSAFTVVPYRYISVDFCVARFTEMGDAKASGRGTGNSTDSTLHFYMPNPNVKQSAVQKSNGAKLYCRNETFLQMQALYFSEGKRLVI